MSTVMSKDNDIRQGRHCVFKMHVHLVFVTKYRRRVFAGEAIERLRVIFARVCADFEAQLIEMDGEDDHVHLLVEYPPKVAVSNLVNSLKGVSSRLLRKERPDIQKRYWKGVPVVAVLLRFKLRWCANFYHPPRHRTATDATLKPKDGYAVRAILPRPERRGLSRTGSSRQEKSRRDKTCVLASSAAYARHPWRASGVSAVKSLFTFQDACAGTAARRGSRVNR
jgi:putative transposase